MSKRTGSGSRKGVVDGVGPRALVVPADHSLELFQGGGVDVQLPFKIAAHFSLHLVDLSQSKHTLTNNTPGLVGVGVVADHL